MNHAETAELLTMAAAYDNRTIGQADVHAWQRVLADIDPIDATDALIGHYTDHADRRIMPADVITRVKAIRAAKLQQPAEAVPDAHPDDVPEYLRAVRENRHRIADNRQPRDMRAAIEGAFRYVPGAGPPPEIRDAPDRAQRRQALAVRCPHQPCNADVHMACTNFEGRPLRNTLAHPSRLLVAGLLEPKTDEDRELIKRYRPGGAA